MMARKVATGGGAYQLVTVAYRKTEPGNTVILAPITCDVSGTQITNATSPFLRIGTPLINPVTGKFARVESIGGTGTTGTLERSVPGVSGSITAYVLVEQASGVTIPVTGDNPMRRSPAIGAMSKMTGLRHTPADPE
jgi:hypothetical protein